MLQNHPQQMLHSPARLGLPNPNSPSTLLSNPPSSSTPKLSSSSSSQQLLQQQQQQPQQQQSQPQQQPQPTTTPTTTPTTRTSSTLLSLLPPLPRAQSLLFQMASLATKLFEVSPNRSQWLASFRGSLPQFLPSSTSSSSSSQPSSLSPPSSSSSSSSHVDLSPSSTKEVLSLFTSLQTQLFEAVAELQEILDLQDAKLKVGRDIRSKDAAILAFAKKLKEAQHVLDLLSDDYADYRRPKHSKPPFSHNVPAVDPTALSLGEGLSLSDILSYAHRISYTTFAPPEFGAGQVPLRGALPPAPQEEQMRASQLYNFADLDVGLPKAAKAKEKAVETLIEAVQPSEAPLIDLAAIQGMLIPPPPAIPSGWRPGMPVELPSDIPIVPPGWKPGDPIPLPPLDAHIGPKKDEEQRPVVQMPGAPLPPKVPEPIQVKYVELDINPDQDEYSSEYNSSEVHSSEEDDED